MMPIMDPSDVNQTIAKAIKLDPDTETSHTQGRFIPLFKSLLYTINYKVLQNYAKHHNYSYVDLYLKLIHILFKPQACVSTQTYQDIEDYIQQSTSGKKFDDIEIIEVLR